MRYTDKQRWPRTAIALILAIALLAITGCDGVNRLTGALYPSEIGTPAVEPATPLAVDTAVAAPTEAVQEVESATPEEQPTAAVAEVSPVAVTETPVMPAGPAQGLVYAQAASLYLGDVLGRDAAEVVVGASLESWAFRNGILATVTGRQIDIIDLPQGAVRSYTLDVPGELMHTRVLWSDSANVLLYAAIVRDDMAANYGRTALLRVVSAGSGVVLGQATVPDVTDVLLLRYDEATGQALIAPAGADPTLPRVQFWDLGAGSKVGEMAVASDGLASVSPDGRYLLTTALDGDAGVRMCYLYDLANPEAAPRSLALPADSHSASHVWSPDGARVAYLLRDSLLSYEATAGVGVWVLDVATMTASEILPSRSWARSCISWTPDSALLVGYHRGLEDGTYFYSVRPDGSDRQILSLETDAEVLGWMPLPEVRVMTRLVIDPWPTRIRAAADDPNALAEVVAQYVAEQGPADDSDLTERLQAYFAQAGIAGQPVLRRAAEGLFVAQLPPMSIYAMYSGRSQWVASGDTVFDARAQDDDLALIYGVADAQAVQPAFVLLRRDADGAWQPLWTPQGQSDWIATNGQIAFVGEGMDALQVSGTSAGLYDGEEAPFAECAECPQRQLAGAWQREGDAYVRPDAGEETLLPGDLYWTMTARTPYAVVYETLRRLRRGDDVSDLVDGRTVERQLRALGLAGSEERYVAEQETENTVIFGAAGADTRYVATVEGGVLVQVERLAP